MKLTNAWRISDGRCFELKTDAYKEQITLLLRSLPKADNKPPVVSEFRKIVKAVDKWLNEAADLVNEMGEEPDVETKRSINGQG